jgi:hypothetical protein
MLPRQPDVRRGALCGRRFKSAGRILVPLATLVIGACVSPPGPAFQPLRSEEAVLEVAHPAFDAASSVHSASRDTETGAIWYVSEVNGVAALGALVASAMPPGQEVVQRPTEEWVRSIIPSRFRIAWGPTGTASSPAGSLPYRLFSMGEADDGPVLACVGFSQRRGQANALGLPREVLYGYLCRHGSRPLAPDVAEEMLASVSLRPEG